MLDIRSLLSPPETIVQPFSASEAASSLPTCKPYPVAALVPTTPALREQAGRAGRPGLLVSIATAAVTGCAKTGDPVPWPPRLNIALWDQRPLPAYARRPADGQALGLIRLTGAPASR